MSKTIQKISFIAAGNGGVKIGYQTFDNNRLKDETAKKAKHPPHQTFIDAMQKLKTHLILIAEFAPPMKKYKELDVEDAIVKDFRVCGFTVSGEGEKEGIILTGYKTLSNGLGFVFNTPNTRVENEGESAYPFIAELLKDIEGVKEECELYLKGKYGKKTEGAPEIPFEEPVEAEE